MHSRFFTSDCRRRHTLLERHKLLLMQQISSDNARDPKADLWSPVWIAARLQQMEEVRRSGKCSGKDSGTSTNGTVRTYIAKSIPLPKRHWNSKKYASVTKEPRLTGVKSHLHHRSTLKPTSS